MKEGGKEGKEQRRGNGRKKGVRERIDEGVLLNIQPEVQFDEQLHCISLSLIHI